jgi:hypothetical protein
MPSVALISATAKPTRSFGSASRMMLIPTGIKDAARPCRPRPASTVTKDPPTATSAEPKVLVAKAITTMRLLPTISASRETIGVATAPDKIVMVTAHDAVVGVTPRMSGRSGMRDTTSVCCSAASMPEVASTPITTPVRAVGEFSGDSARADLRTDATGATTFLMIKVPSFQQS